MGETARPPLSLNRRLLRAASVVLALFLGLAGWTLDRAWQKSALAGRQEALQALVYMLLGVAEEDGEGGLRLPEALPDGRLGSPGSGLYALVAAGDGDTVWRSRSSAGVDLPPPLPGTPGRFRFDVRPELLLLHFAVEWEADDGRVSRWLFTVAESAERYRAELTAWRRTLWGWLAGAALALLLVQGAVLAWGLAPVRRLARAVEAVEAGGAERVEGRWPAELASLAEALNALIRSSRARLARYRQSLDDLAHTLKTPLAVLRNSAGRPDGLAETVREQVARMDQAVQYHLQRAAAAGTTVLARPVALLPLVRRVAGSLARVYGDRRLRVEIGGDEELRLPADEGDLMEIVGNLLDNAHKWAASRVRVTVGAAPGGGVKLVVEEDGPGIEPELRRRILERGVRADSATPGQGLGLALVRELVEENYRGRVAIDASPLGGARVTLHLPV